MSTQKTFDSVLIVLISKVDCLIDEQFRQRMRLRFVLDFTREANHYKDPPMFTIGNAYEFGRFPRLVCQASNALADKGLQSGAHVEAYFIPSNSLYEFLRMDWLRQFLATRGPLGGSSEIAFAEDARATIVACECSLEINYTGYGWA